MADPHALRLAQLLAKAGLSTDAEDREGTLTVFRFLAACRDRLQTGQDEPR